MVKTKAGIVIGARHVAQPQVVEMDEHSVRLQRALLARQARWLRLECWLDFFNEAIEPLLWSIAIAGVIYGLLWRLP